MSSEPDSINLNKSDLPHLISKSLIFAAGHLSRVTAGLVNLLKKQLRDLRQIRNLNRGVSLNGGLGHPKNNTACLVLSDGKGASLS
jgi:hypothetical protein